ncbi:Cytochrome c oxidase assembly factor 3, mitochondrial [Merluccius polli]|uniref:Cytochrome c oxidase assembly factor 3 n=1 Tax=Merluccius polli TaxID=89951 RepID=A0AA47LZW0_MERPO|nr:Cytochrome c oxidase assembly factor 3, mitochondrial [Merluccius polli]
MADLVLLEDVVRAGLVLLEDVVRVGLVLLEDVMTLERKSKTSGNMAEKGAGNTEAQLSAAQKQLLRRRNELDYWKKNAERIRGRNRLTGLAIGAFVVVSYTILSVKQEKILDEIDDEAKIKIWRGPRTGANS